MTAEVKQFNPFQKDVLYTIYISEIANLITRRRNTQRKRLEKNT